MRRLLFILFLILTYATGHSQDNSDCLACHEDKTAKTTKDGKTISLFVEQKRLSASVHAKQKCIDCHVDLKGSDFPHTENPKPAQCLSCHPDAVKQYSESLHGRAKAKGDPLAPTCKDCHGNHDILKKKDIHSATFPLKVPFLCGKCHKEGSPVQLQRNIPQSHIFENYSESIHGEGLLKKGLTVAATCASCHTPHLVLPHTDPRSSIARKNIAATCTQCHMGIENVHRKIIKGELWEKEAHVLPACVDCHQPHKARKVFYDQGMADSDCMKCHSKSIKSSRDGHVIQVDQSELKDSRHAKVACSQCHAAVNPSKVRPCESITKNVDCASCHAAVGEEYKMSTHGKLFAKNDKNAPFCAECHGTHHIMGKKDSRSPIFPTNIPILCAQCHEKDQPAARRIRYNDAKLIEHYSESIHGKGLLKSGLTVTATCTDCHSSHRELPASDPNSSINPQNIATTCGNCHSGIKEKFMKSVHSPDITKTTKQLPICNDCHSSHLIKRTDQNEFKLGVMTTCGKCHEEITKTYFETYHGKVSQLGYTKTAKCYDCHGSHEILPVNNPASLLSRQNVVKTCQKCHPGANRRFAGYLTHATHHDPQKYPWLFFVFWGMTILLVGTFIVAGTHTLLWLPRSLQWKKQLREMEAKAEEEEKNNENTNDTGKE
ncbi:MAG: cytochrome c3 family protein [Ignavibacteria bacterium]|nr:cytochrome c3 family protein [Ignavibacteria bacterium]